MSYTFSAYGGLTVRLKLETCTGAALTASDVTGITYTVYEVDLGTHTAVTGHNAVTVPTTCILAEAATSPHATGTYNFEHRISAATHNPFPNPGLQYIVVYTFSDADGDKTSIEIAGVAE